MRQTIRHYRLVAALLLAAALCLKAVTPVGFMVDSAAGATLSVRVCGGQNLELARLAIPNSKHGSHEGHADASQCPYAALSLGALGADDPWLLAAGIAFALLLGLAPLTSLMLPRLDHEAPPLRGPPISA